MRTVLNNRVCSPPQLIFLPKSPSRRTSQYEDIPDPPSDPHARVVAGHNVLRWRTQPDRAGVFINPFSFRLFWVSHLQRRF